MAIDTIHDHLLDHNHIITLISRIRSSLWLSSWLSLHAIQHIPGVNSATTRKESTPTYGHVALGSPLVNVFRSLETFVPLGFQFGFFVP